MSTCGFVGWTPKVALFRRSVSSFWIQALALLDISKPCLPGRLRFGLLWAERGQAHQPASQNPGYTQGGWAACLIALPIPRWVPRSRVRVLCKWIQSTFLFLFQGEHSPGRPSCLSCQLPLSASMCSSQCPQGTPNGKSGCRPHRCTCHFRGAHLFQVGSQNYRSNFQNMHTQRQSRL